MSASVEPPVGIIGAGFCGLSAAYELGLRGIPAVVFERDQTVGGLAGSFEVNGVRLEKFYHHWFTNDDHVTTLVEELGVSDHVIERSSRTGMYYAHNFYRLSTPLDLLRFNPLSVADRVRLGILILKARRVSDWKALESATAAEWLQRMGGQAVFDIVWEPLLRGKFGDLADEISAVWIWNKLKLRGGSRDKRGSERLLYFRGGFAALAEQLAEQVTRLGGEILTGTPVQGIEQVDGQVTGIIANGQSRQVSTVLATQALPEIAELLVPHANSQHIDALRRVRYLANICVVLELDRSLSDTYWLNVSDPSFPFVGVIEHTNFEPPATYGGRHIVYLSKYLMATEPLYQQSDDTVVDYCLGHLERMFPALSDDWLRAAHVWRAPFAQPIIERDYGRILSMLQVPLAGFRIATMAQIYPEDRGTNYAIRQGREAGRIIADALANSR